MGIGGLAVWRHTKKEKEKRNGTGRESMRVMVRVMGTGREPGIKKIENR